MNRLSLCLIAISMTYLGIDCRAVLGDPGSKNIPVQTFKNGNVEKRETISALQSDSIDIDNKLTPEEKEQYNSLVDESNKYVHQQAAAANKIPGVKVDPDDLKEKKKGGLNLNPIKWLFGPVIKLQEQSTQLEQQIMKLTGPIAALQPGMLSLEQRITSMQKQLAGLEDKTTSVQKQLADIRHDIASMHTTLSEIKKPVTELREPIMSLRDPIMSIQKPITGVDKDLTEVKTLLGLVLTSIFAAAVIIALGTPIAAILVWRNRQKLLPKPDAKQEHEEDRIKQATKTMDNQLKS